MKKKDEIYMTSDEVLVVNGKEYLMGKALLKKIDGIEHLDKQRVREFNRDDFNKKIELIAEKISGSLTKEELLKELLKKQPPIEIDKLYKLLSGPKSKSKPKKITKQEGCLGIKIGTGKPKTGGRYIQLID